MSTIDLSGNAEGGMTAYRPGSPFRSRKITVDLAAHNIGASGADTLNLIPLADGEFVHAAYLREDEAANATSTLKLDDSRTGGGAILAASAADAAAGTTYLAAGAGVGKVGTDAGYLTLTTGAAVAVDQGKVTVYAIIGEAF